MSMCRKNILGLKCSGTGVFSKQGPCEGHFLNITHAGLDVAEQPVGQGPELGLGVVVG